MAGVILRDVTKTFGGGVVAADRVSFEVSDREFLVLVGPSGCGKSTILRLIAGLEELDSGEIRIDGRTVNDVAPKDRDIAMVFQNYALYPHMTVSENLAFGLKMQRVAKDEISRSVKEAAEILGIEALLERKPGALSGGQRQRVALGRALVRNPKVFLFDEPLSNLDARLRVQMRAELIRLHREIESTIIYVTHDQVEAMTMGSRIVVLDSGRVQQIASPMELYSEPTNTFVAEFIGSPSMNFADGRVVPGPDGSRFEESGGSWSVPLAAGPDLQGLETYGRVVRLGIRPENMSLTRSGSDAGGDLVPAEVEVVEPLGYDTYVTCRSGPCRFIVRGGEGVTIGERVGLAMETGQIKLFDAGTGSRLR